MKSVFRNRQSGNANCHSVSNALNNFSIKDNNNNNNNNTSRLTSVGKQKEQQRKQQQQQQQEKQQQQTTQNTQSPTVTSLKPTTFSTTVTEVVNNNNSTIIVPDYESSSTLTATRSVNSALHTSSVKSPVCGGDHRHMICGHGHGGGSNEDCVPGSISSTKTIPLCKCGVCARLPIRCWDYVNSYLLYHGGLWDFYENRAVGIFGFTADDPNGGLSGGRGGGGADNANAAADGRVVMDVTIANIVADRARRHLIRLQKDLAEAGLLAIDDLSDPSCSFHTSAPCGPGVEGAITLGSDRDLGTKLKQARSKVQYYSGPSDRARIIAPFYKSEVVLGQLLGCGGFASVYQVDALITKEELSTTPNDVLSMPQIQAREFMAANVQRNVSRNARGCHGDSKQNTTRTSSSLSRDLPHQQQHRYAMKRLRRPTPYHGQRPGGRRDTADRFEKSAIDMVLEAQLLAIMDHQNIVGLRGWSFDGVDSFRSGNPQDYFLIMDYLPATLDDRIFAWRNSMRKYRSRLSPLCPWSNKRKFQIKIERLMNERLQAAVGVASALEYMHKNRIIHRDIKCSNIGFDGHGDIKIFDLGLARLLPKDDGKHHTDKHGKTMHDGYNMSRVGTKSTMAPEVRNKKPYNLSADVYSFGVVLWEIMSLSTSTEYFRRFPLSASEKEAATYLPLPLCDRGCWPRRLQRLIQDCLSYKPSQRPTMAHARIMLQEMLNDNCLEGVNCQTRTQMRRRSTFRVDLMPLLRGGSSSPEAEALLTDDGCDDCNSDLGQVRQECGGIIFGERPMVTTATTTPSTNAATTTTTTAATTTSVNNYLLTPAAQSAPV